MKKLLVVLLALVMLFASVSCDDNQKAIDEAVAKATQALEEKAEKEKKEAVTKAEEDAAKEKEEALKEASDKAEKEKEEAVTKTKEDAAKEKDEAVKNAKEETKKETRETYQNFAESYSEKDKILNFVYDMVAYNYTAEGNKKGERTRNKENVTDAGVISKTFSNSDIDAVKLYMGWGYADEFKKLFPELSVDEGFTAIKEITSVSGTVSGNLLTKEESIFNNYIDEYEITISDLKIEFNYRVYDKNFKNVTTSVGDGSGKGVISIDGTISQKYDEKTCIATHSTKSLKVQEKTYSDISAEYNWLNFEFTSAEVEGKEVNLAYVNNQLF